MPSTYTPIATTTLSGSPVTNVTFSSIPQTYTDLVLVSNIIYSANGGDYISLRFNNNSTNGTYAITRLTANGSTVSADGGTDNKMPFYSSSTTQYVPFVAHINNYSNTTTFKTALVRLSNAGASVALGVGSFASTAAITQLDVFFAG